MKHPLLILGGGPAGLAAAWASKATVLEARNGPGGICSSYFVHPRVGRVDGDAPDDAYIFEVGGGHWIFGDDRPALNRLASLESLVSYRRRASVCLPQQQLMVPYPLQGNLHCLEAGVADRAVSEIAAGNVRSCHTQQEWLLGRFGPTLNELFFEPFHQLYTAGLHREIAPQDFNKSPAIAGSLTSGSNHGYNVTFRYPKSNLGRLFTRLAECCDVRFNQWVVAIDAVKRQVTTSDGCTYRYDELLATLPLNQLYSLVFPDRDSRLPYVSVLVVNLGGARGARCPEDHWVYLPHTRSGFHRVGFYSNVSDQFLPGNKQCGDYVSAYVERSFRAGAQPTAVEVADYLVVLKEELANMKWVDHIEVADPTWVEVAYTYEWSSEPRAQRMIRELEAVGIRPIGRYARWRFQGILESFAEGWRAGSSIGEVAACA